MSASSSNLAIPADLMLPTDMVAELEDTPSPNPATSHPKEGDGSSSSSPSSMGNSLATNLIGQPPRCSGEGSSGDDSLASSVKSRGSKGGVESAPAGSLNTSLRQSGGGGKGGSTKGASSLPSTKIYNLPVTLEKKDSIAAMASDGAVFYEIPLNSNDGLVKNAAYRRVIDTYRRRRNTLNRQIASDLCPSVSETGPCPAGGNAMNCTLLHTEKPLSTYPVLPIHVNVPFSTQEVANVRSPHRRLPAGTMIPVWTTDKNSMQFLDSELLYTTAGSQDAMKHFGPSSAPAPVIPLPSTNAFATTTADSQTDDTKQQQVKMQLCSHFCAKMCLRGPECNFLHIVHVEEREDEYSEPILSQLLRRHAVPKSPAQGRQASRDRSESFSSSMAGSSLNSSTVMQTPSFPTATGGGPTALEKTVIPNLSIIPHPPGVVQPQPDHPVVPALNASGGGASSGTGSLSSATATPAPAGFLTKPPHHQQPVVAAASSSSFPMMMMPPTPPTVLPQQQQQPVMMVPSATVPGHFVPVNAPVVPTAMAPTPAGAVYVPQQHAPQIPVQPPQMAMMMNPQGQQVLVPVVVPQPLHPQQQQHHQQQPVMMMTPPPAGIVPQHPRQQQ